MIGRFWRYAGKTFDLWRQAASLRDARIKPQIPLSAAWSSVVGLFVTRLRSLNGLDQELRVSGRWDKMIGPRKLSGDSAGRLMGIIEPDQLRQVLSNAAHQLRRNKTLEDNPWPLRVVVLDGHEFFRRFRMRHSAPRPGDDPVLP
jgi:hypothetical protein